MRLSQPVYLPYIRAHALYHFFTSWHRELFWLNQQSAIASRSKHLAEVLTQKVLSNQNTLVFLYS